MMRKKEDHSTVKQKILELSEISLWLDSYDDIFSDFDPRPFSVRALSGDFLDEARKASRDKEAGKFELKFLLDKRKRNHVHEHLIKSRLKDHFRKHYNQFQKEQGEIIKKGLWFVVFGVLLMFAASYILFNFGERNFVVSFFIILLEPAGWFLFWEGLDLAIFEAKRKKPMLEFYEKMVKCRISFMSYNP